MGMELGTEDMMNEGLGGRVVFTEGAERTTREI